MLKISYSVFSYSTVHAEGHAVKGFINRDQVEVIASKPWLLTAVISINSHPIQGRDLP
jgi:hypothetical protein